jgi:anti-anti-sigma factor
VASEAPANRGVTTSHTEVNQCGTTIVVRPYGDLDLAAQTELDEALRRTFDRQPETLVLDLEGLTFMDATGIHLAMTADKRARSMQIRLVIIPGPLPVQRVFEIAGVSDLLPFGRWPQFGDDEISAPKGSAIRRFVEVAARSTSRTPRPDGGQDQGLARPRPRHVG